MERAVWTIDTCSCQTVWIVAVAVVVDGKEGVSAAAAAAGCEVEDGDD